MKIYFTSLFILFLNSVLAQKTPPYNCGFYDRDTTQLIKTFETNLKYWEVQKGEIVASIGAGNGNLEVRYSIFVDSIKWTLQEIDTTCLNKIEFEKVLNYYQKLSNKKIIGNFDILIGTESKTNLKANNYDRILLINVYHELTKQQEIITEIYKALITNGKLVIMERVSNRKGKKRKDCNHLMTYEPDLLKMLTELHFEIVSKTKVHNQTYFIFKKMV